MEDVITFGQIVRERRLALGLTQAELARRVHCATITIRKIEYDTLRPSVQVAERLVQSLNIPKSDRTALVSLARKDVPRSPVPTPTPIPEEIGQEDLTGRAVLGYELGERIGSGGFGVVYQAVQRSVNRDVAVKIILPEFANQPPFIRRFEAEAQTVAGLEHPHIVPLYDFWREPNAAYLIMRLLRGGNLVAKLRLGPISQKDVQRYFHDICQALHMAHRNGIVHRDIKPANILLDEDDNAYLADFGIAKYHDNQRSAIKSATSAIIGSPAYSSPEQFRADPVKPQSDIYSLGILLYEMLTGEKPFLGPTPRLYIQQHFSEQLPSISNKNRSLPAALDSVLLRATAKNEEKRYPDALAFLEALLAVLGRGSAFDPTGRQVHRWSQLSDQELANLENPYKGLRPFTEADSEYFFGRDGLIHDLLSRISESIDGQQNLSRFLAVVGPSGSGKSSLVKAGLIPALRRGGVPGSDNWFVVDMVPSDRPLAEMATALTRVAVNPPGDLLAMLQKDDRGLHRAIDQILPEDKLTELLLVIDQFEEIFTLVENERERSHLLDSLVTAVLDEDSRLRVIVALRADFIHRPLGYVDFAELVRSRTEFVTPLSADELEEVINKPLLRLGMAFEPGLVAQIIEDVGDEPGKLPLLQYALTELFERRGSAILDRAAYAASGGVLHALGRRADQLYTAIDHDAQEATRQIFLRLITLGEDGEVNRRRVPRSELLGLTSNDQPKSLYERPLHEFGRFRLLTFDHDPQTREPTVEMAHEALITEWRLLRDWLDVSRQDVHLQRMLASMAREWNSAGNDPSYYLRGARLADFEQWATHSSLTLTSQEQAFLSDSVNARHQRQAEEEARRQQELETAQRLAAAENKRAEEQAIAAHTLRRRALYLAGALGIALLLAVAALIFGRQASQNASLAASREAQAVAEANQRATTQAFAERQQVTAIAAGQRADQERIVALAAQSTTQAESFVRATAEAQAKTERQMTEQQAQIAFSRELAAAALLSIEEDPERSILLALEALNQSYTVAAEDALHQAIQAARIRHTFTSLDDIATQWVAYSPKGDRLFVSGLNGGTMWNPLTGSLVYTKSVSNFFDYPAGFVTSQWINKADFSPDGSILALPNEQFAGDAPLTGTITLLSPDTGTELLTFPAHPSVVFDVSFNSDGTRLASIGLGGPAKIWDVPASRDAGVGALAALLCCHDADEWGLSAAFSPDDSRLVTISEDRTVKMWDIATESELFSVEIPLFVTDVEFSPDGKYVVAGTQYAGTVYFIDAENGEVRTIVPVGGAQKVLFSPDGTLMATTSPGGFANIWEYTNGDLSRTPLVLSGHTHWVNGVTFSPDSRFAVTGSWDGTARLWDISPDGGAEFGRYLHESRVWEVNFAPNGRWLASVGADETVAIWDVANREMRFALLGHEGNVRGLAISPDSRSLATTADDGTVRIWDAETGQEVIIIQAHEVQVSGRFRGANSVDFSPTGDLLVTGGGDRVVRVWDSASGEKLFSMTGHADEINTVAFSPDGRYIASAGTDQTIKLWSASDGKELWTLSDIPATIWKLAFSHDGTRLAAGHNSTDVGGQVALWQLPDPGASPKVEPELLYHFEHNSGWVAGVNFSPDDSIIVAPGLNRVSLHNTDDGEPIIDLFQPEGANDADFSPDGRIIALAGNDGSVHLMAATLDELMDLAQTRLTRELTTAECQQYLHVDACPIREK